MQVECSKARACPSGVPSCKCLPRINTLAYLAHLLFTKKKHCAGSTVTENSAHNPRIEGLNTAGRWKMAKYMQRKKKFCKLVQVECRFFLKKSDNKERKKLIDDRRVVGLCLTSSSENGKIQLCCKTFLGVRIKLGPIS